MKPVIRKNLNTGLFLMGVVASTLCLAEDNEYRWENNQGVPVFSDRPPADDSEYEVVESPALTYENYEEEDAAADAGDVNPDPSAIKKEQDAMCEQAKMNLIALEKQASLQVRNEKGEVKEMSPEEREFALGIAQARIERYCD